MLCRETHVLVVLGEKEVGVGVGSRGSPDVKLRVANSDWVGALSGFGFRPHTKRCQVSSCEVDVGCVRVCFAAIGCLHR